MAELEVYRFPARPTVGLLFGLTLPRLLALGAAGGALIVVSSRPTLVTVLLGGASMLVLVAAATVKVGGRALVDWLPVAISYVWGQATRNNEFYASPDLAEPTLPGRVLDLPVRCSGSNSTPTPRPRERASPTRPPPTTGSCSTRSAAGWSPSSRCRARTCCSATRASSRPGSPGGVGCSTTSASRCRSCAGCSWCMCVAPPRAGGPAGGITPTAGEATTPPPTPTGSCSTRRTASGRNTGCCWPSRSTDGQPAARSGRPAAATTGPPRCCSTVPPWSRKPWPALASRCTGGSRPGRSPPCSAPGSTRPASTSSTLAVTTSPAAPAAMWRWPARPGWSESWTALRLDTGWATTLQVAAPPSRPVTGEFLQHLLVGVPVARRLSLLYVPTPAQTAERRAQTQQVTAESEQALRMRWGFAASARHRRSHGDAARREADLVDGRAVFRLVWTITLTAATLSELDAAVGQAEAAARRCGLELRRLVGTQRQATVFTLPLCRGAR